MKRNNSVILSILTSAVLMLIVLPAVLPSGFNVVEAVDLVGADQKVKIIDPVGSAGGLDYSAKFICGTIPGPGEVGPGPLSPATYWTAVNIHNPQLTPVD